MVLSSDGQNGGPPTRPTLRIPGRQSMTGVISGGSPKGPHPPGSRMPRASSPGTLGSGTGSPMSTGAAPSPPFGDMQRLPRVSESGDKGGPNRPPASVMLRRSSTLTSISVNRGDPNGAPSPKDSGIGESNVVLKKERNALRMDKNVLLLNKRRLEGMLSKLLEQPLAGEEERVGGGGGSTGHRPPLLRASTMRAHLLKALDESTGLEKQLGSINGGNGGGNGGNGGALFTLGETDARSKDLAAKMAEMQSEHETAIARLEGELSYRRTQATAATAGLQKQLSDTESELTRVKQQLAAAEAQNRQFTAQSADMRTQLHSLASELTIKNKQLVDAREMLGMDKATMNTVIEMLKDQLREANTDRATKARMITELEYAVVHRDALLTEAHERMSRAAQQAAAAAAAGVSSSAAVARAAASMQSPLEGKAAWGMRASTTGRAQVHGRGRVSGSGVPAPRGGGGGNLSDHDSYSEEAFDAEDMEA